MKIIVLIFGAVIGMAAIAALGVVATLLVMLTWTTKDEIDLTEAKL